MALTRATNILLKLDRAVAHINAVEKTIRAFSEQKPYTVRVKREISNGRHVGRLIAMRNPGANITPSWHIAIIAGEALYQLRSVLDHAIHDIIIDNGQRAKITIKTQFPIFDNPAKYRAESPRKIAGVPKRVAAIIGREQPYARFPNAPHEDPLWLLHELNNTDKHRFVSAVVRGLHGVTAHDSGGELFTLASPDIMPKHQKVFFSFTLPDDRYREITADLTTTVAFKDAMTLNGTIAPMHAVLAAITERVWRVLDDLSFRGLRRSIKP